MRNDLPSQILQKKKTGFAAPVPVWINNELKKLIDSLLSEESIRCRGMFRPQAVAALIEEHRTRRRDNSYKIWSLVMLELWFRLYIDSAHRVNGRELAHAADGSGLARLAQIK